MKVRVESEGTLCRILLIAAIALAFLYFERSFALADETSPQVEMSHSAAGPRAMESLTEQSIVRDYRSAWKSMTEALASNSPELLGGHFVGTAESQLTSALADQKKTGLRTRYLNQSHKLRVMFYAPEGDVMQLHDTVTCKLQLLDRGRVVHDENVVLHYVVLMTPSADRWVIRQLQSVPQF